MVWRGRRRPRHTDLTADNTQTRYGNGCTVLCSATSVLQSVQSAVINENARSQPLNSRYFGQRYYYHHYYTYCASSPGRPWRCDRQVEGHAGGAVVRPAAAARRTRVRALRRLDYDRRRGGERRERRLAAGRLAVPHVAPVAPSSPR